MQVARNISDAAVVLREQTADVREPSAIGARTGFSLDWPGRTTGSSAARGRAGFTRRVGRLAGPGAVWTAGPQACRAWLAGPGSHGRLPSGACGPCGTGGPAGPRARRNGGINSRVQSLPISALAKPQTGRQGDGLHRSGRGEHALRLGNAALQFTWTQMQAAIPGPCRPCGSSCPCGTDWTAGVGVVGPAGAAAEGIRACRECLAPWPALASRGTGLVCGHSPPLAQIAARSIGDLYLDTFTGEVTSLVAAPRVCRWARSSLDGLPYSGWLITRA